METTLIYRYNIPAIDSDFLQLPAIAALLNSKAYRELELSFDDIKRLVTDNEAQVLKFRRRYAAQFADRYPEVEPKKLADIVHFPYEQELQTYPHKFHYVRNQEFEKLWQEREKYICQDTNGKFLVSQQARAVLEAKHAVYADPEIKPLISALEKVKESIAELHELLPAHYTNRNQALRQWAGDFFENVSHSPQQWRFADLSRKRESLKIKRENPNGYGSQ